MYTCIAETIEFTLVCLQLRIQELEAELKQKNIVQPTQGATNVPQTHEAKNVVPLTQEAIKRMFHRLKRQRNYR